MVDRQGRRLRSLADHTDRAGEDVGHVPAAVGETFHFDRDSGAETIEQAVVAAPQSDLDRTLCVDPDARIVFLDDQAAIASPRDDAPHRHGIGCVEIRVGHDRGDREQTRRHGAVVTRGNRRRGENRHACNADQYLPQRGTWR